MRGLLPWALVVLACRGGDGERSTPAPETSRLGAETTAADAFAAATLVDIATVEPGIQLDIRYATADNFTGKVIYPRARCLLRRAVAERLAAVHRALRRDGLGLRVWDCYRPFSAQKLLWERVPDGRYVARPVERGGVPVEGSKHNRGAAVDLTLVDADGAPLEMPTGYDDFTPAAHRATLGGSEAARANARRLEQAMVAEGFEPLATEWWHFDGPGWQEYPLSDQPL